MSAKPIAIDLYCGLGGWTEGLLAEGYHVVGFDIERHVYGEHAYPAQLVLQDVLTIHGRQFKDAALIVASPPCQGYSYRAMPWKRAKALPPPDNSLFEACFRIQREASDAAGRYIPLVVENVLGAQKWVGRSRFHFGSFHLWGDVPALMPPTKARETQKRPKQGSGNQLCAIRLDQIEHTKNNGGSWFNVAHNTTSGLAQNPVNGPRRISEAHRSKSPAKGYGSVTENGIKQVGDWFNAASLDGDGQQSILRRSSSKSPARKAASAMIAKIPLVLSRHIGKSWHP